MRRDNNIVMLETVAKGLGKLKDQVVFIGGATVSLYLQESRSSEVRPTDDVDCVVEMAGRKNYYGLQTALEKIGFRHSIEKKAPICRMDYKGIKVDIMPSDPQILGFSNIWYLEGIRHAVPAKLSQGEKIKIFSLPYFIAAKIEAYFGRGKKDFRLSSDIEDIVAILNGQPDLNDLSKAPEKVRAYLKEKFKDFIGDSLFLEALSSHLEQDSNLKKRAERLLDSMNYFCTEA